MKTVLKYLVVGLMVFALNFSPALAGLAKAGGFNFESISSIKTDDTQSYEKQPRGLMFNFSIGGPKDYKKTKSQVAMWDKSETWSYVGFVAVIGIIALTIDKNHEDTLTIGVPPEPAPPPEN